MSKDALKDIQQALNIIRSATDKEQYATKVKAMELVTQSLLSQIQTLKPIAVVKNKAQQKQSTARKPSPLPIPKSLNTPKSANSPNAIVPNQPNIQANTASDNTPLNY